MTSDLHCISHINLLFIHADVTNLLVPENTDVNLAVAGGHPKPHIWNKRLQFACSLYNFYGATTTSKGSLHGSTPIVKRFSVENFLSPVKIGPKMTVFREIRV